MVSCIVLMILCRWVGEMPVGAGGWNIILLTGLS